MSILVVICRVHKRGVTWPPVDCSHRRRTTRVLPLLLLTTSRHQYVVSPPSNIILSPVKSSCHVRPECDPRELLPSVSVGSWLGTRGHHCRVRGSFPLSTTNHCHTRRNHRGEPYCARPSVDTLTIGDNSLVCNWHLESLFEKSMT